MSDQPMIVVEAEGDPNVVGASAFKRLFSAYYTLDGVSRMGRPPAPRARWLHPEATPKDQWLGQYALPLSGSAAPPRTTSTGGLRSGVAIWHYGDVAEILHVGSYSTEKPDIERLLQFISERLPRRRRARRGIRQGAWMLFAGNPEQVPDD